MCVCQSVGNATRTAQAWATTIHTLTWRRRRARTARRSRHHPLLASLRNKRVSHSQVLREGETAREKREGEQSWGCMLCSMCVLEGNRVLIFSPPSVLFFFLPPLHIQSQSLQKMHPLVLLETKTNSFFVWHQQIHRVFMHIFTDMIEIVRYFAFLCKMGDRLSCHNLLNVSITSLTSSAK